jgi:hypothetical protein
MLCALAFGCGASAFSMAMAMAAAAEPSTVEQAPKPSCDTVLRLIATLKPSAQFQAKQEILQLATSSDPQVKRLASLAWLTLGESARAAEGLRDRPQDAVYAAMAIVDRPGGLAAAKGLLAQGARHAQAGADTLYMAALAFYAHGEPTQADTLLKDGLQKAERTLDVAFAPDPFVALASAAYSLASRDCPGLSYVVPMLEAALDAGRHAWVLERIDELDADFKKQAGVERVLFRLWDRIDAHRATEPGRRWLELAGESREARVLVAGALYRAGAADEARALLKKAGHASDEWENRVRLLEVQLGLDGGDLQDEDVARLSLLMGQPGTSSEMRALALEVLGQAQCQKKAFDRAEVYGHKLLGLRPIESNPFDLLGCVAKGRGQVREADLMQARAGHHQAEVEKMAGVARKIERRFDDVVAARGELGAALLMTMRQEDPQLSLPIDFGIARIGQPGARAAARARILRACSGRLRLFLRHRGAWERSGVDVQPYGRLIRRNVLLSHADPFRCRREPPTGRESLP